MDQSELRGQLEAHHREAFGWALSCSRRDQAEAENLLQDVYLKVLDGRARFDRRSSFKTWLFAVIRKTAADQWRRRLLARLHLDRHRAALKLEESSNSTSYEASRRFENAVYRGELETLLRQALEELPRRQQEVLLLVFYHDMSLQEAAEVMKLSVGSARQHYDRGKKRLRQLLERILAGKQIDSDRESKRVTKEAIL